MTTEAPDPSHAVESADYRLLVDAVADYAIFLLDENGQILTWNNGARRIKGYAPEDIIGRHFSIFYPQEAIDRGWPDYELQQARAAGRFEDEGWRLRKDGSRFWANVTITALTDAEGRFRGFSKITRDLSKRRRQEELLRQSEERFRLIVEGVKDYAIFMLDPGGYIVSWNTGAQRTKGWHTDEIIGRHFSTFYPQEAIDRGWPAEILRRALADGRVEDEGWRLRKDGSRFWASVVITALFDESGEHRGFAKVTRDLTEKHRVRVLEEEGRRITTFLAMLGHELRNPLAPIANALAVMQLEAIEAPPLRAARDVIARQLQQLTRLVDDLLDVGRITSGKVHLKRKAMLLDPLLEEAAEAAMPAATGKSQALKVSIDECGLWVDGDRARLLQVLGNLLGNAVKYTPVGGRIELRLSRSGAYAEISVRDNGLGIPAGMSQAIFGLFVQGEQDKARSEGGLGVGLNLVQQLVALHDGDVAVFSEGVPGKGSEFVVRLPLIAAPAPEGIVQDRATVPVAPAHILVVDDNRDSANTMVVLLERLGYQAGAVYGGLDALAAVRTRRPDAVLLDIGLADLDGIEVARTLSAEMVDPPKLVAVTGYGQEHDRAASYRAGCCAHLTKPVEVTRLLELLQSLLQAPPAA